MMLGTVFGALISGQLLSRTGDRCKLQGGIGIAPMPGISLRNVDVEYQHTTSVIIIAWLVSAGYLFGMLFISRTEFGLIEY
jgi:hypothetical protein